MVEHTRRNYSAREVREIVGMACSASNLSSEHIIGMVCLADLLKHIDGTPDENIETQVQAVFDTSRTRTPRKAVALDDIDD